MVHSSGRQRVEAVFQGTFADRVPSCPILNRCNAQLVGASVREYLTDPKIRVKAQLAAYERYKPDILVMKGDKTMEAEAMGNVLRFPEDSICYSIRAALEDKGKLGGLTLPDPARDGRMGGFLEALAEIKGIVADSEIFALLTGPWTMAVELRTAEELLRDATGDPLFFHELMGFTTRMSIGFGEAVLPLAGRLGYSECYASSSFISSGVYRKLVFPYHRQVVDHFRSKGIAIGLHICGNTDPIIEDLVRTGAALLSLDAPTDLAGAVEVAGGRAVLMGNVNNNLFSFGRKDNMRKAIENCIRIAGGKHPFILATGCEISSSVSPSKVDWFMELARELGSCDDNPHP
jgi:uroporphyrinogen decarboxylase